MNEIIARSKLKWYVNPMMVLSIAIVVGLVFDLATGAEFISGLLNARRGGRGIGLLIIIPTISAIRLWFMRRVTVYSDRIEVTFPLHKNWNYQIPMKDVDCYCLEFEEVETQNDTFLSDRLYLLSGRRLWMFISESDCANYEEMRSVLDNHFRLSLRKGTLCLSKEEMKIVKRGGSIVLEDISDDELIQIKEQHRERSAMLEQKNPAVEYHTRKGLDMTSLWPILILATLIGVIVFLIKVSSYLKNENTISISVVDENTVLPSGTYLVVDSMDVDSIGAAFWHTFRTNKGIKSTVTHWAFFVRGRQDVIVTMTIETDDIDRYSEVSQRRYCYKALHRRHKFELFHKGKESARVLPYIKANMPYKTINENCAVVSMCDGPLNFNLFKKGLKLIRENETKYDGARMIVRAASEGDDKAFDYLEWMYSFASLMGKDKEVTADAFNELSYVYANEGKYEKAIETIDKAIVLDSTIANYYDSKGEHLYRMGKKDEAMKMWQKVMSLDPDFAKQNTELYRLLYGKE